MASHTFFTDQSALNRQEKLIRGLGAVLEKENDRIQIFETHISWVLVTPDFAYKFKKAVHLDFLDFSTLEARRFYCHEELRLNRRLAPDLYLSVASITGDPEHPRLDASGAPIEYAVKMRTFPQQALWNLRLASQCIAINEIDLLARKIAQFHRNATPASMHSAWGTPDVLKSTAEYNLSLIASLAEGSDEENPARNIQDIQAWEVRQQHQLRAAFVNRKAGGWVRECHGDLHSGNILTIDERVEVFDCIEFNEGLRWIDVMNDIAFIGMDLQCQGRNDLAARLLDQYLAITGDYEGLSVLHYYQIHRALVRCKVSMLRARQLRTDAHDAALPENQAAQYLAYAAEKIRPQATAIMIMHGYSGSGKSVFSKYLVELTGAIRIRSDVERKRMHGLSAASSAAAPPGMGFYDPSATRKTYDRLRMLARQIVESGMPVVVDAAFLKREQRSLFENMAHDLHVPFFIFTMQASDATMRARIAVRAQSGQDVSDAGLQVFARQLAEHDPLSEDELTHAIVVDSESCMNAETVRKIAHPALQALHGASLRHPP